MSSIKRIELPKDMKQLISENKEKLCQKEEKMTPVRIPVSSNPIEVILCEVISNINHYWNFSSEKINNLNISDKTLEVREAREASRITDHGHIQQVLDFFDLSESSNDLMVSMIAKAYVDNKNIKILELDIDHTSNEFKIEYLNKTEISEEDSLLLKRDIFMRYVNNEEDYDFKLYNEHSNFYKFLNEFDLVTKSEFKNNEDGYITEKLGIILAYLYKRKRLDNFDENKINKFLKKYKTGKIKSLKYTEFKAFIEEFREVLLYRNTYANQIKEYKGYLTGDCDEKGNFVKLLSDGENITAIGDKCSPLHKLEQTLKFIQLEEISILRCKLAAFKIPKVKQLELYSLIFEQMHRCDCIYVIFILKKLNQKVTKQNAIQLINDGSETICYLSKIYDDLIESFNNTGEIIKMVDSDLLNQIELFILSLVEKSNSAIVNNEEILDKNFRYIMKHYEKFLEDKISKENLKNIEIEKIMEEMMINLG